MLERLLMRWNVALGVVFMVGLFIIGVSLAAAHGDAEWIMRGDYRAPTGEHCCGPEDCFKLDAADVAVVPGGYMVKSVNEFIPAEAALLSEDGNYWRCKRSDGSRRCFFAPGMGS